MNSSERDFVKRELQKTGFQLEDKVASIFSKLKNCEVEPNYYFTDWQSEDLRELDLRITYEVAVHPIIIEYIFLVECKKLPGHAWVFIESRQRPLVWKQASSVWDDVGKKGRQKPVIDILKPLFKVDDVSCDVYSHRFKEIILDPDKSNKKDDNIRCAAIKLAKAMYHEDKRNRWIDAMLSKSIKAEFDHIRIYYPLIVFEGKMYKAEMLPEVNPKEILTAHLHHSSIQNKKESEILIDVINIQGLRDFIQEEFLAEADQIRKNEARVRDSYLTLIKKLMSSRRKYLSSDYRRTSSPAPT